MFLQKALLTRNAIQILLPQKSGIQFRGKPELNTISILQGSTVWEGHRDVSIWCCAIPPVIYTRQKLYFEFSSGRFDIHPNFHLSSTEVGFWIFYFFKEAPCYQTGSCLIFFCVQRATISVSKSSPGQRQHMDFLHTGSYQCPLS